MTRSLPRLAWLLLGILALAAIVITLGRREETADPKADSFRPSGLSAFAQILRDNGYEVVATASNSPALDRKDVVVECVNERTYANSESSGRGIYRALESFHDHGGRALVLPFDPAFRDGSAEVSDVEATRTLSEAAHKLRMRRGGIEAPNGEEEVVAPLWYQTSEWESQRPLAWLTKVGKGLKLTAVDGYIATNRFIDAADNATMLMNLIATLSPKPARVVFVEGTFSPETPSLVEILGPGAEAAWYQFLFLFVVVVYSLGKRFGLAESPRATQVGQRELVDAVADCYQRAKLTRAACRAAYDRADHEVRRVLRLSSDAPVSERDLRLPEALALEFRRVFEGTIDPLNPAEAFARCAALRRQVSRFIGRS